MLKSKYHKAQWFNQWPSRTAKIYLYAKYIPRLNMHFFNGIKQNSFYCLFSVFLGILHSKILVIKVSFKTRFYSEF